MSLWRLSSYFQNNQCVAVIHHQSLIVIEIKNHFLEDLNVICLNLLKYNFNLQYWREHLNQIIYLLIQLFSINELLFIYWKISVSCTGFYLYNYYVFVLYQLIYFMIICMKILKYVYRKNYSLKDILYFILIYNFFHTYYIINIYDFLISIS